MPAEIIDVDEFTMPATTPAGADPANAASILTPVQKLANRTRWLYNRISERLGGVSGAGEWTYPSVHQRNILASLHDARTEYDTIGTNPRWAYLQSVGPVWKSLADNGQLYFPLGAYLRDGMVIRDVRVAVNPGAQRAGTDRMRVALSYALPDFSTPGNNPVSQQIVGGAYAYDSGAALSPAEVISLLDAGVLTGAGHTVDRDNSTFPRDYYVEIRSGNDGGTNNDLVFGVWLVLDDPGPRNF